MPTYLKQGQGLATEMKQRGLSAAFSVNLAIFKNRFNGYRYFHFDLNSGSGYNSNCIGSPLAFVETADKLEVNFNGWFVDHDITMSDQLSQVLGDDPRCHVVTGDNAEFITRQISD
jgi:hypothetical protein